jgi:hypothetical protein
MENGTICDHCWCAITADNAGQSTAEDTICRECIREAVSPPPQTLPPGEPGPCPYIGIYWSREDTAPDLGGEGG